MAASAAEIRAALVDRLEALEGVASAYEYETEQLGELPCLTLVLRGITPAEQSTGPRLDLTWTFELRLYCGLSDWEASQRQIDALIPPILQLWRDDPTLDHLIEWWRVRDVATPIEFNTAEMWMRKTLVVEAQVEEV